MILADNFQSLKVDGGTVTTRVRVKLWWPQIPNLWCGGHDSDDSDDPGRRIQSRWDWPGDSRLSDHRVTRRWLTWPGIMINQIESLKTTWQVGTGTVTPITKSDVVQFDWISTIGESKMQWILELWWYRLSLYQNDLALVVVNNHGFNSMCQTASVSVNSNMFHRNIPSLLWIQWESSHHESIISTF